MHKMCMDNDILFLYHEFYTPGPAMPKKTIAVNGLENFNLFSAQVGFNNVDIMDKD